MKPGPATAPVQAGIPEKAPDRDEKARKPQPARKAFVVPPLLLEGDLPVAPPRSSGPGSRYALTAEAMIPQVAGVSGELPESYGTKHLFLAARDPHWLFASWDLNAEQQHQYNSRSRDGRLRLRIFASGQTGPVLPEVELHPESRSWFVHVPEAEKLYHAELGYFESAGGWISIAVSRSTFTPPEAPAPEIAAEFATIPPDVTFQQIVATVQQFIAENEPLLEAVLKANAAEESRPAAGQENVSTGRAGFGAPTVPPAQPAPSVVAVPALPRSNGLIPSRSFRAALPVRIERGADWTAAQAKAVARLISVDSYRRVWMGSLEITELIRRRLEEEISSIAAAQLAQGGAEVSAGPFETAPSSLALAAGPESGRGFWFKINAELIIYGSTEPDATVTVADRPIKLRPDGSFSFRFSLPDGRYRLPAVAVSRAGDDGREARLEFSRGTEYLGHVGEHPQEAALRPPLPENLA